MGSPATNRALGVGALALGLCTGVCPSAQAQEYCVACSGPDAVYRCVLEKAAPTGIPLKVLCTSAMAREGGHATCTIRGGTVFDCNAPIHRIDAKAAASILAKPPSALPAENQTPTLVATPRLAAPASPPSPAPNLPAASPPSPALAPAGAPPSAKPKPASSPQTVEQLAKDMSRASKESLGKASDAIGGTTRKAWDCIASFFKFC